MLVLQPVRLHELCRRELQVERIAQQSEEGEAREGVADDLQCEVRTLLSLLQILTVRELPACVSLFCSHSQSCLSQVRMSSLLVSSSGQ